VLQDVFLAIHLNILNFRRDRPGDSFRGWVRVITRNKILNFVERRRDPHGAGGTAAQLLMNAVADEDPASENADGEFAPMGQLLLRGLELIRAEFEPLTWQAFWMTAVDARSAPETAHELQISAGAVRQAKYKVLRRLRQEFAEAIV
jgi:RNA polymerase sigma-70 factor (ECF subfamily)